MLAEIDGDRISFPSCSYHEGQRLKSLPGTRWSPDTRLWSMALSWAACQQLRAEFGPQLEIGPELTAWAWREKNERVDPSMALRLEVTPPEESPLLEALEKVEAWYGELGHKLFEHQRTGALFMATAQRGLLGDEVGTGKSATTITMLNVLRALKQAPLPALIICPNSMKRTWQRELATWAPDLDVRIVTGSLAKRQAIIDSGADVLIINWEGLKSHSRLAPYGSIALRGCVACDKLSTRKAAICERCERDLNVVPFKTVVCDEVHRVKGPRSVWTRAAWAIAHGKTVEYAWGLTGTPIANHPGDLWSVMHLVAPHENQARSKWLERYALLSWNLFGGMDIVGLRPEHREEFFRIFDPRFRRMPKELVLPFLPPKLRQTRYVTMHAKQERAYKRMKEHMVALLEDDDAVIATSPLVQATRLLQFSSSYAEISEDGEDVLLSEPSCKLDAMDEILEELGDEPLVVCAESAQLIRLAAARLLAAGIKHSLIIGGQGDEERQRAIDDFQSGAVRVVLFTMKAGGVGLTLTRAGHILFLQRSWSMIDNKQAEGRIHRIGSEIHDKVLVIDLITEGTIETHQLEGLAEKLERSEEIVRDRETLRAMLA